VLTPLREGEGSELVFGLLGAGEQKGLPYEGRKMFPDLYLEAYRVIEAYRVSFLIIYVITYIIAARSWSKD
jgi:hypothetical protein